jgi:glucose-6-phosphate dehydrogenase assembly protein OpcA
MAQTLKQIRVLGTLDVEAVERELADLWKETAAESDGEDALLRARAANLMVFLPGESTLAETHQTIAELASIHPCRALVLVGEEEAAGRDIEIYVSAFCATEKRFRARQLCCEEVTLTAAGEFVSELPSAAMPLLIPDMPVFLWWRDGLRLDSKVFRTLLAAVDRLVIDSADFHNSLADLAALAQLLAAGEHEETAVSDVNWARLTAWRASLANFYDVPSYRVELDNIDRLRIDYVAQDSSAEALAAQPLLVAGWLAGRLGWGLVKEAPAQQGAQGIIIQCEKDGRTIDLELNPLPVRSVKPGRIVRIELQCPGTEPATFVVSRSEDGLHLETTASIGSHPFPGRRVPYKNRSAAELLSREMEILCVDKVYEEAIRLVQLIRVM